MTYKEFKRQVFMVYNETYSGADVSPIEYGIQRAKFEETKLERLIALACQTEFSTAKRKVEGWRRQLERVHEIRVRLEHRRTETPAVSRLHLPVAPIAVPYARSSEPARLRS